MRPRTPLTLLAAATAAAFYVRYARPWQLTWGATPHSLDPPHSMIWGTPGDTTWTWQLDGQRDGSTRLITRVRSRYRWLSPSIAFSALLEFGDIWMMRKMLLNLRVRAEGASLIDGFD
jgi:hypothetical protein